MSADPFTMSSEVEVAVDPATAFDVFTEEMDLWWVRSPISFFEGWKAVEKRCEPGVGGRLLEVYDDEDASLELGRITVWEPGARLAWISSVDDAEIDVRFEPSASGTVVRVTGTVQPGGHGGAGLAWVRVGPPWLAAWVARRDRVAHEPVTLDRLAVAVYYAKPVTAAHWLHDVFGFEFPGNDLPAVEEEWDFTGWIEFHVGHCSLIVLKADGARPEVAEPTHVPWVFVDDIDAHFARAEAGGARIVEPIHEHGYRGYVADDLEGHRWTFAHAGPMNR